jgi:septum formation protein
LLALLGISFDVRSPSCDERLIPGRTAEELTSAFAQAKARSVAKEDPEAIVLGSDTLVELDGTVLGKPDNLEEARRTLRLLAGRRHAVHSAVALSSFSRRIERSQHSTAHVWMKPYSAEAHERYLASGDSLGKAGAYAVQGLGSDLIERLDGDFTTVVGMPLRLVAGLLTQAGVSIPVDVEQLYKTKPFENWARMS